MELPVGRIAALVIPVAVVCGMISHRPAPPRPYQTVARGAPIDHVAVIGDSYTTGTDEGGWGSNAWTTRTWSALARQGVDPMQMAGMAHDTFDLARRIAPASKLLVIGPPWPTADPPFDVLYIRDTLSGQANDAGATFIDPISEGWFVGRPDLIGPDGVHPNDAGHAYMAEKIAPLIHAQLSRRA